MKPIPKDQPIEPIREAQGSPCRRARMSVNLQKEPSVPINRSAIAVQLDILVCPHRHRPVRVLLFPFCACLVVLHDYHDCVVTQRPVLGGKVAAMKTQADQGHAVLALDACEVISEVKNGLYMPITSADFAQWASGESQPEASTLPSWYESTTPGERFVEA